MQAADPKLLRNEYAVQIQVSALTFSDSWLQHRTIVDEILAILHDMFDNLDHVLARHPPALAYKVSWLRRMITLISESHHGQGSSLMHEEGDKLAETEALRADVLEAVCDILCRLTYLPSADNSSKSLSVQDHAPDHVFRTYFHPSDAHCACEGHDEARKADDRSLTLIEDTALTSNGTTGLRTWRVALSLGAYLIKSFSLEKQVSNRAPKILELGSGCGFVGLLCAQRWPAANVVLTDAPDSVLERCETNRRLSQFPLETDAAYLIYSPDGLNNANVDKLDWLESLTDQFPIEHLAKGVDLVLASDIIFDESLIPGICTTLRLFAQSESNPQILIAASERGQETQSTFLAECRTQGLQVRQVDHQVDPMDQSIFVGAQEGSVPVIFKLYQISCSVRFGSQASDSG